MGGFAPIRFFSFTSPAAVILFITQATPKMFADEYLLMFAGGRAADAHFPS
jgi:hypothetical protein